ncbi:MAG: magnesium transporter [Lachnospiraceae bacterium]|nr:magnesium transporter [Lachnospiraceae bacterium]
MEKEILKEPLEKQNTDAVNEESLQEAAAPVKAVQDSAQEPEDSEKTPEEEAAKENEKETAKESKKGPNYEEELLEIIRSDLSNQDLLEKLDDYHENDIAGAMERLTVEERKRLYPILGAERVAEIFTYIEDVDEYLKELEVERAAVVLSHMDSDDAVDVLEEMDEEVQEKIVSLMDDESSRDVQLILSYDEDEIGSQMTTNFIHIHNNLSVRQAMHELVKQAGDNDNISTIYVEDENDLYYGAIDLKDLIIAREYTPLEDLISTSYPYVKDKELISDCIERIKDYAEDSLPVINDSGKLIGIITAQDIVEVVDDEMGEDYAKLAGLTAEEDLHERLPESMKKRLPWLIALLFLGMMVSTVVGVFETVVAVLPLVICFQSLILDMAGNVGTQSLAVTIRVLMDENLTGLQKVTLVFKEMRVGFCNGLFLGFMAFIFIGLYVYLGKHNPLLASFQISGCVGFSLLVAMMVSSMVGTLIPMFFHKIKVDPAVASGPLITTVNDLVAVVTYYGLAWVLLVRAM